MVAHLEHIRTKYVFFVFPSKRKSLALFPQVKNISLVVLPSKRKYFCFPKQSKTLFLATLFLRVKIFSVFASGS